MLQLTTPEGSWRLTRKDIITSSKSAAKFNEVWLEVTESYGVPGEDNTWQGHGTYKNNNQRETKYKK